MKNICKKISLNFQGLYYTYRSNNVLKINTTDVADVATQATHI